MVGFSWVIEGELAGMPRPGGQGALAADLEFLRDQGIALLVSLTEDAPIGAEQAARCGMELLHIPIVDFAAPALEQLERFVARAGQVIGDGRAVAVHCAAGRGRTGTMLAGYLVATRHMTAHAAIAAVRSQRPGSIETPEQEAALAAYHDRLFTI